MVCTVQVGQERGQHVIAAGEMESSRSAGEGGRELQGDVLGLKGEEQEWKTEASLFFKPESPREPSTSQGWTRAQGLSRQLRLR